MPFYWLAGIALFLLLRALATPFFMLHVWSRERGGLLGNRQKYREVAPTNTSLTEVFGGGLGGKTSGRYTPIVHMCKHIIFEP